MAVCTSAPFEPQLDSLSQPIATSLWTRSVFACRAQSSLFSGAISQIHPRVIEGLTLERDKQRNRKRDGDGQGEKRALRPRPGGAVFPQIPGPRKAGDPGD